MAKSPELQPLAVFSAGFLRQPAIHRILTLAGWKVQVGVVRGKTGAIGVWGRRPVSRRGLFAAKRYGLPVLTIEDPFLRSVRTGTSGEPPLGLLLDRQAPHFDCSGPSDLENLLCDGDLDDPVLLARAADGIAYLRKQGLSKYNAWTEADLPDPGFVLVVDQTRNDASITYGGADEADFQRMLERALAEHPDRQIVIRAHPDTATGAKQGHFTDADAGERVTIFRGQVNPWEMLTRAHAVYCVTSQLGFEAILAGHRPVVLGQPFYSGWGLSADDQQNPRRSKPLSSTQLFAAALLIYPVWFDPYHDRLGRFEDVARTLAAKARAWREDLNGWICIGMKPWKFKPVGSFLSGAGVAPEFFNDVEEAVERARKLGRPVVIWAGRETGELRNLCAARNVRLARIEDGFLRSVGLGAHLLPAASLVIDDLGIYFDPEHPSRLEQFVAASANLTPGELDRAKALRLSLIGSGITKYNVGGAPVPSDVNPGQKVILVPGQAESDASIRCGAGEVRTNLQLLECVRRLNPDAHVIYKPHPDVEAGLRLGEVAPDDLARLADHVARATDAAALIDAVDEVWTITSQLGFEALLRGKMVHCLGMPFYAGWGLTRDHGKACDRRAERPSLDALVHAVLIDYPRYFDPVTRMACPPEVVVDRLAARVPEVSRNPSVAMRLVAKLQSRFRRYSYLWRQL